MVNIEKAQEVADFWGNRMPMMTMEEAGELIQAISKYERKSTDETLQNLIDEIGDMYISLLALRLYYGIDKQKIDERINNKLNKKY